MKVETWSIIYHVGGREKNRNLMVYVLSFNGLVVGGVGHYGSLNDINEWRSCRFLYFRLYHVAIPITHVSGRPKNAIGCTTS